MKKVVWIFCFFLLGGSFTGNLQAQNFEFETLRTPQSPGFFMVRIFPGEGNPTLPTDFVFVQGYPDEERALYEKTFPLIQEIKGKIIRPENIFSSAHKDNSLIIWLGEKNPDFLSLVLHDPQTAEKDFEEFVQKNLIGIVMKNIKVDFGGNIESVLPSKIPPIAQEPIFIVGKFVHPRKTQMTISGEIYGGWVEADEPLDLHDESLSDSVLATQIPDIWESLWQEENLPASPKKDLWTSISWLHWNNLFPFFLFLLGVLSFWLAIRNSQKNEDLLLDMEDFDIKNDKMSEEMPLEKEKKEPAPSKTSAPKKTPLSEKEALKMINPAKKEKKTTPKDPPSRPAPFVDMPQIQDDEKKENKNTPSPHPKAKAPR